MIYFIKNLWYYSKYRFYLKNTIWNYNFWLKSKKIFEEVEYNTKNESGFYDGNKRKLKKFKGFLFKGKMYLDNPGFPINDRDLWVAWKNKGLIK